MRRTPFSTLRGAKHRATQVASILAASIIGIMVALLPQAALSRQAAQTTLCDAAARDAARQTGVPAAILMALTRMETGRQEAGTGELSPWPWAVNVAGRGHWFRDRDTALGFLRQTRAQSGDSFDVGCFQINHRWHGHAFDTLDQMLNPAQNALYAAQFLKQLHAETGDWSKAAGAYHSRTPRFARIYRARFDRIRRGIVAVPPSMPSNSKGPKPRADIAAPPRSQHRDGRAPGDRMTGYPLLLRGTGALLRGSLVPVSDRAARPFIAQFSDGGVH